MHILMMILGVVGGAIFWMYRLRDAGRVAGEVVDTAQRVKGAVKRRHFRKKANQSPIEAIDDPVVGAATAIICVAQDGGTWTEKTKSILSEQLGNVANASVVEEAVIYGEWAANQMVNKKDAVGRAAKILSGMLGTNEKEQLMVMADCVLHAEQEATRDTEACLLLLRRKLGLEIH